MAIADLRVYAAMQINGLEEESFGHVEFRAMIQRILLYARDADSKNFSTMTIRISKRELTAAKIDDSNNPYAGIDMSLVEMATPEEEAEIARVLARNNSPHRNNWTRGAHSESYRNSLTPDEWFAAREEAKRLWPDEYEKWRHLFNG